MSISLWRCMPLLGKMFYLVWRKINLIGTPLCYANKSVSLTNVWSRTVHIHYFLLSNTFLLLKGTFTPQQRRLYHPGGVWKTTPPPCIGRLLEKSPEGYFSKKIPKKCIESTMFLWYFTHTDKKNLMYLPPMHNKSLPPCINSCL